MGKFRKTERLCSRESIGKLFSKGKVLFHYPFRLVWIDSAGDGPYPVRIAISVPKKRIKKAVTRNRIRRVIRESYRINKSILYESPGMRGRKIDIMLLYISDKVYDFDFIDVKLKELIHKFIQHHAPGKNNI
ncbi:MAG: ribonuclease P protein component [Bacteroidales bacterium]